MKSNEAEQFESLQDWVPLLDPAERLTFYVDSDELVLSL